MWASIPNVYLCAMLNNCVDELSLRPQNWCKQLKTIGIVCDPLSRNTYRQINKTSQSGKRAIRWNEQARWYLKAASLIPATCHFNVRSRPSFQYAVGRMAMRDKDKAQSTMSMSKQRPVYWCRNVVDVCLFWIHPRRHADTNNDVNCEMLGICRKMHCRFADCCKLSTMWPLSTSGLVCPSIRKQCYIVVRPKAQSNLHERRIRSLKIRREGRIRLC